MAARSRSAESRDSKATTSLRLLIIVRSLNAGGAERQLVELLKRMDTTKFSVSVACFYGGLWASDVSMIRGVDLHILRKRGRYDVIGFLWRLWRHAARFNPDLIYGYMHVSDVLALAIGRGLGVPVAWGLRSSVAVRGRYGRFVELTQWLTTKLAKYVDLIISNSGAGVADLQRRTRRRLSTIVIPNGIDTKRFCSNEAMRVQMRASLAIPSTATVFGLVGRIDPVKGHAFFIGAASEMLSQKPDSWFVCAGGVDQQWREYREQLLRLADELGISHRVVWTEHVERVEQLYAALDVLTSASDSSEGFSNVIAEAMACGVPCVVTDVGDSRQIVGNVGVVVAPGSAEELVRGWLEVLDNPQRFDAPALRMHVVEHFEIARCVAATEATLADLRNTACVVSC